MKFEMENEPSPVGRPHNGRKRIVMIACTAVICVILITVYVRHEAVNRQERRPGDEPGLRGHDKEQGGAPGVGGQPDEPLYRGPTGSRVKTRPSGPAGPVGGLETVTEGIKNMTASEGIVEGIIAGTHTGVVIIPLDSREQIKITSKITYGVAFNWQSRKVYWIENRVGIKIADMDGSHAELLISDPKLFGLAVDQITGNLYYGVTGTNPSIRVCDSMGQKCVNVASGINNVGQHTFDIALLHSDGLMFWSSPGDEKSVTRANMDGTNATVITSEIAWGMYLDEFTEKLYWADNIGMSIGHLDLNGYNRNVLLNTTTNPIDIALDGDTLYFGGVKSCALLSLRRAHSVECERRRDGGSGCNPNGVYSVTSNRQVSSFASTTGVVYHIALFGRNKVSSRPNPCKNSPCSNLCVLTRLSHTCL